MQQTLMDIFQGCPYTTGKVIWAAALKHQRLSHKVWQKEIFYSHSSQMSLSKSDMLIDHEVSDYKCHHWNP